MLNAYLLNTVTLNGILEEGAPPPPPPPSPLTHKATDVLWQIETLDVNMVAVYGEAADGSLVSGQAYDSDEVSKVGYRLDIVREPAIPTADLCTSVAQAIIAKMRLQKARGALSALPNCAIELFDVVQITDRWANLDEATFRVSAISLSYDRETGNLTQTLSLFGV